MDMILLPDTYNPTGTGERGGKRSIIVSAFSKLGFFFLFSLY